MTTDTVFFSSFSFFYSILSNLFFFILLTVLFFSMHSIQFDFFVRLECDEIVILGISLVPLFHFLSHAHRYFSDDFLIKRNSIKYFSLPIFTQLPLNLNNLNNSNNNLSQLSLKINVSLSFRIPIFIQMKANFNRELVANEL